MLRGIEDYKDLTVAELNDLAAEEVVADGMELILTDGKVLNELANTDKSLWNKVKEWITDVISKIKKYYGELSGASKTAQVLRETMDSLDEIERLFTEAVQEAGERTRTAEVETSDDTSQVIFYSANEKNDSVEEQLRENQYLIQDMDPVADITYNVVNKQRARLDAHDIFREAGYKVDRQGFGIIEIGENQLSDSTRYLNNPAEFAAWMCIPKVLKRGRVISGHENHKNRGYPSITIAAPVVINGKRGDVAVVVQQKGKNKYYVHRILMPDGSRFEYENTKNAESTGDSIVGKKTNKRLSIDSASNDSITQPKDSVKRNYSLSEKYSDEAYLAAVERGDMETAQRMVDEAARAAGYANLFYHGAKKGGGFTVFRDWSYFTENRAYAERYTDREKPGSLYKTYVKINNTFDTRKAKDRKLFAEIRDEYGLSEIQDTGLPDWTDGYDIADYIDENDLAYDSIVLDEGGDLVDGVPISRGLSYVVRKSAQIKSADPVTYDDAGNVIPLSERFNEKNPDIRYSLGEAENGDVSENRDLTDREILGMALEGAVQNEDEWSHPKRCKGF